MARTIQELAPDEFSALRQDWKDKGCPPAAEHEYLALRDEPGPIVPLVTLDPYRDPFGGPR